MVARTTLQRSPGCVLVVEDDKLIRELLVEQLTEEGYAIRQAGSVAEATDRIAEHLPALIVLDLMLPGQNGWDFLRRRSADRQLSSIPVILLSAAPHDLLLEAKKLGAEAFLSKPFDIDALSRLVRSFAD